MKSQEHINDVIVDPWSYLGFKEAFKDRRNDRAEYAPTWVTDYQDRRRLTAYTVLEAYFKNMSKVWLRASDDEKDTRREYGDPYLLVEQIVASILGETFEIQVAGAAEPVQDRLESQESEPSPTPEYEALVALQEWAKKEKFANKVVLSETNAVKLGDSVIVLGWHERKSRVRMEVWNPGFFFPVQSDDGADDDGFEEEFPSRVHLAYEFDRPFGDQRKRYVRRITYWLEGTVEDPSAVQCWMSDGEWAINEGNRDFGVYDLEESKGVFRVRNLPLGIDFIPVVHLPNTQDDGSFWGVSSLAPILQIVDDLQATDTDLQAASAIVGTPPIAVSGLQATGRDQDVYGPGTVWNLGDGRMSTLDTSDGLKELVNYKNELLERLSVNSRVPESVLGRVKPSDVPSGIALWLSFAPHSAMINNARRIRKYDLVLEFVQKFMVANGDENISGVVEAYLDYGSYLPADKMETLKMVVEGLNAKIPPISVETAVEMLVQAGVPVGDAQNEVRLIEKRLYAQAVDLGEATKDVNAARRLLGLPDMSQEDITEMVTSTQPQSQLPVAQNQSQSDAPQQ